MSGEIEVDNHHLNGNLPADIPEDLREFLPEAEGLSIEEAILQQASVYQSYQESVRNRVVATDDDHISEPSCSSEDEDDDDDDNGGDSLRHESVSPQPQEAMDDEAYARTLQEFEEFDELIIREYNDRASGRTESPIETLSVASLDSSQQDDIDPDNMGYEDLLRLGETAGVENVGLSAAQISRLRSSIHIPGMFSKNKEEICTICQENFKFLKALVTLPCSHQYHSKCIIKWLKLKKNCPVCQKEVV